MKQIVAIIRAQQMNRTRTALADAGFSGFTARKIIGRGRGNVDLGVLHGAEAGREEAFARLGDGPMLLPRRMLTIVVADDHAEAAIQTIISSNKTGEHGDGKIFVLPVKEAVRIRTRERGHDALTDR